jgi:hypothetical protein|tara:strand:+ start:8501 stop:9091 length:591 start_codon:yes stop_codon:yes gene_type:complete
MRKTILTLAVLSIGVAASQAAVVRLDNVGSSTGANLDGISTATLSISVPEISGLFTSVHNVTGGGGASLNSTATSLGINSDVDTDTDAFEATFSQSATFSFSQSVSITQLDLTNFTSGEVFQFGSTTINNEDLSNGTLDTYDFSTPLILAADEQFTMSATAGIIGIEALTLTVVPEPSSTALLGLGGLALILRRRM